MAQFAIIGTGYVLRVLPGGGKTVVTTETVIHYAVMVEANIPLQSGMAGIAFFDGLNMQGMFAGGSNAIVTATAGPDHCIMAD